MDTPTTTPAIEYYTPKEFRQMTRSSRSVVYRLLRSGQLNAKRLGGKLLIPAASAKAFLESLPDYQPKPMD